jgi:hypothetical protein
VANETTPQPENQESEDVRAEDIYEYISHEDQSDQPEVIELPGKKEGEEEEQEKVEGEEVPSEKREEDELSEFEEEVEREDIELTEMPRKREILAKYPNVFKDFPGLEKAYYRERAFTEVVPTIEDAKVAVAKAQLLDNFEKDILGGNIGNVLKIVRENDEKAFLKIADGYLDTLANVDKDAYLHTIGNVVKRITYHMAAEARKTENNDLNQAAHLLYQFIFGNSEYEPPKRLYQQDKEEVESEKVNKERRAFVEEKFTYARDNLQGRVDNSVKATITEHIDPKNTMTDYVKTKAVSDACEQVKYLLSNDRRLSQILDKLWVDAFRTNFNQSSLDKIRSAYISRARTLLPQVITKTRNEAMRGLARRPRTEDRDRKGPLPPNRESNSTPKIGPPKKGQKTLDFLNED